MELAEKVRSVLTAEFSPPATLSMEDDDRIVGVLVSPRFEGMDRLDRVNLVWDLLERHLNAEERRRVLTIVAITPEEEVVYSS